MCPSFQHNKDLYGALGIQAEATVAEVKTAYRHKALQTHPDKGGCEEAFHLIALAFEVLSCPISRNVYDKNQKASSNNRQSETFDALKRRKADLHWDVNRSAKLPKAQETHLVLKVHHELESLRSILQSMEAKSRQLSLVALPTQIRSRLLDFMQRRRSTSSRGQHDVEEARLGNNQSTIRRQGSLRRICVSHRIRYQACIRLKALRMYTREQCDIDLAVEHQLILASVRQKISQEAAQEPHVWLEPDRIARAWIAGFEQCGTTEHGLGLRTFLEFRAYPWLGSRFTIASPAMSLLDALRLNARLLQARSKSWEALRAEWIQIMMKDHSKRSRTQFKNLSMAQAESIVDKARQDALAQRVPPVVRRVESLLRQKTRVADRAARERVRREKRERDQFWKARRQHCRQYS